MSARDEVRATVFRYNPERDAKPRYETYVVPHKEGLTMLGVLQHIYEHHDGSLAFSYECRYGSCGTCAVTVNGRPTLICNTPAQREVVIEPLPNLPVIRDLVVDRSSFDRALARIRPFMERVMRPVVEPEELMPRDFDTYRVMSRCTRCLGCLSACPVVAVARNEYSGPTLMVELAKYMFDPRDEGDRAVTAYTEGVFNCSACMRCTDVCPYEIPVGDLTKKIKGELFRHKLYPREVGRMVSELEATNNVYGLGVEDRTIWPRAVKDIVERRTGRRAETAYFIGCVSSSVGRLFSIPRSFILTLEKLRVDYAILGPDEWCCGEPFFLSGGANLAERFAKNNVENIRRLGVRRVVSTCAGCYRVFKDEYPELLGEELPFEVLHSSELLAQLLDEGRLKFKRDVAMSITYHDPCELGRHSGVYEEPRIILDNIPGLKFIELPHIRRDCVCCGGGGLVKAVNPGLALKMARRKLDEARDVGADAIVSGCPACKMNVLDAVSASGAKLEVLDIAEVVAEAVGLRSKHQVL